MPTWWQVLTDAAIPAAAILVSSGIAVWLARSERQRATQARELERIADAAARNEERFAAREARERERRDKLVEDLIDTYGFFIAAHPAKENWAPAIRTLRARVILLQTIPTGRVMGEWLASRQDDGMRAMSRAMRNPWMMVPEDPKFAEWNSPLTQWANEMINAIASWARGDLTDEDVRAATNAAKRERRDEPPNA